MGCWCCGWRARCRWAPGACSRWPAWATVGEIAGRLRTVFGEHRETLVCAIHRVEDDFGIARLRRDGGERVTRTGMVCGTPEYMSPEQGLGKKDIDGRADQFSVGAILYQEGEKQLAEKRFLQALDLDPENEPALRNIIEIMIDKDAFPNYNSLRN